MEKVCKRPTLTRTVKVKGWHDGVRFVVADRIPDSILMDLVGCLCITDGHRMGRIEWPYFDFLIVRIDGASVRSDRSVTLVSREIANGIK